MISLQKSDRTDKGFTIVELMIATSVLSLMLIMITVLMLSIGRLYYKGINQARVQDSVRSITDEISKHLELGDNFYHVTSGAEQAYCLGSTRYTYILYRQMGTDVSQMQSPHVLWRDNNPTPGSCPSILPNLSAATPTPGGTELMAPHARLINLSISGTSPYTVSVGEAYGDNDLLCDTGAPGDCNATGVGAYMSSIISGGAAPTSPLAIHCKGKTGDQFCATAKLTTTVVRRLP